MCDLNSNLTAELTYTSVVNYAIQQNKIPIVRNLIIENSSENNLENLSLTISSEPNFTNKCDHRLDLIPKNQSLELNFPDLKLIPKILSDLTEKLIGHLILTISSEERILLEKKYPIEVLTFDQWNGIGYLPEMLASFCTPNHPELSKIIIQASSILESWTGNPSLDAYQSQNPDRIKKQMGAIFEAIASLGIVYCSPPASFEKDGQRIRMCDTIFTQKLGTCIDLALLYASCLEAIGLHPLLVILKGHAFVGSWLIEDIFPDCVNDDVSLLKKRSAKGINEIILIETTFMNAGSAGTFDESITTANHKLNNDSDFLLFIDIKRARYSGIRPLPQRVVSNEGWSILESDDICRDIIVPSNLSLVENKVSNGSDTFSKQKLWERKLLDLTLRNNLLNLRITQSTIQLISVSLHSFEDALADGDEFQLLAKPEEWINTNQGTGIYQPLNESDPLLDLVKHDLSHKRLRTYLTDSELKMVLTKLYRSSRLSLEENGANTLYLALGFLKWYETSKSELPRYAPILLLPIEIIRKSAQKGYVIRNREEDTLMNVTLLEMLKQEFSINIQGLEELPQDESGVDVNKIFHIIRRAIMSQKKWDLEEHAFIGIFSFNKFIMWNDIHNNAQKLKANKIVSSLISGKLEWKAEEIVTEVEKIDNETHPTDLALPISADSTQLEAIIAASQNKSFILHGPPGTGKSQTITNIIANALYQGKKVLFVAEKMAALSVVEKRLADIGIAPFCLELHSNKSKKTSILEQLQASTDVIKKTSPLEYIAEADRLHALKLDLNEYVEALHKPYHFGGSLYDCFNSYAENGEVTDKIKLEKSLLESLTKEKIGDLCDLAEELQNSGTLCGHPFSHPLERLKTTTYNPENKNKVPEIISKYIMLLNRKIEIQQQLKILFFFEDYPLNKLRTEAFEKFLVLIIALPDCPGTLLNVDNADRVLGKIIELAQHGRKRDAYRNELLSTFYEPVLVTNAEQKLYQWKSFSEKWLLVRTIKQAKIKKELKVLSKSKKIESHNIIEFLEEIISYQKEQRIIDENAIAISKEIGFLWNNGNCDWINLIQVCEILISINKVIYTLTKEFQKITEVKLNLSKLLANGHQSFIENRGKSILEYNGVLLEQNEIEEVLYRFLEADFLTENDSSLDWSVTKKIHAEKWIDNLDLLRDWTVWNRTCQKVRDAQIFSLAESYVKGELKNEHVSAAFKKSLYRHLCEYIISQDIRLSMFNGKIFEGKIKKFQDQSRYFEELTKAELFAKLASRIPSFTQEASTSSEIGILQRAIRNKGRAMSIRKLFDSIPNLLPRLCPCMLMSPISVAQYFDVDQSKFDLVIFDEASQMPTCEAVGAIARAQNSIVVGDPKQMPPTNFFTSNYYDEENADREDMESILDDCLTLSMPSKYLRWHYRSKHESLIAFSNSKFYENMLFTFPSPDDISTKVTNVFVPGYYDRGKSRQNAFEAKAIVEEVIFRLSDPILSNKSIGIVTFSSVQQNLIEDLLNDAYKSRPELEKIALDSYEPIFIKNLENVQGDERDIILFSVGYGPDKDGQIYLNFGPLNREGGKRRLNVAVSRARYEMKVFSTLRSEQIDISRSSSDGVAYFKAFLEYSENGKKSISNKYITKQSSKYFEQLVATEISKLGFLAQTNIGCSGYRIDIGIVNPDNQSEYVLGIITDGHNYKSAKTAKDREVVQIEILKKLGWNIYKLWSPDWWDNPKKVLEDIEKSIKAAQLDKKESISDKSTSIKSKGITQEIIETKVYDNIYKTCYLETNQLQFSDDFFDLRHKTKIINQIKNVLDIEAPISHSLLSRRILSSWNISRLGVRLNEYLSSIYNQLGLKITKQNGVQFYWQNEQIPSNYQIFRIPENDNLKRNSEDLPVEEISNGIKYVLSNLISLPEEDLIKETARLFGYARLGENVGLSMRSGIEFALEIGLIVKRNDRLVLRNN